VRSQEANRLDRPLAVGVVNKIVVDNCAPGSHIGGHLGCSEITNQGL